MHTVYNVQQMNDFYINIKLFKIIKEFCILSIIMIILMIIAGSTSKNRSNCQKKCVLYVWIDYKWTSLSDHHWSKLCNKQYHQTQ